MLSLGNRKRPRDRSISRERVGRKRAKKISKLKLEGISQPLIHQERRSVRRSRTKSPQCIIESPLALLSIATNSVPGISPDSRSTFLGRRVAYILNTLCKTNGAFNNHSNRKSVFFKSVVGPGEVQELVDRIETEDRESEILLTFALIFLDRVQQKGTRVYRDLVVRLFGTCVLVATKVHKDERLSNLHLSWIYLNSVDGKRRLASKRFLDTIHKLEAELLGKLEWRTFITAATFKQYKKAIYEFSP